MLAFLFDLAILKPLIMLWTVGELYLDGRAVCDCISVLISPPELPSLTGALTGPTLSQKRLSLAENRYFRNKAIPQKLPPMACGRGLSSSSGVTEPKIKP